MDNRQRFKIFCIFMITFTTFIITSESVICCLKDQLESKLIVDFGNVFIDQTTAAPETALIYDNLTGHFAYDLTNKRIFYNVSGIQLSPEVPRPMHLNATFIVDYAKGTQYTIIGDSCQKDPANPLHRQCIPDNAVVRSSGTIGNKETQTTLYSYQLSDDSLIYEVMVESKECTPILVNYYIFEDPDEGGTLGTILFGNITKGIKDPSIFNIPKICLSDKIHSNPGVDKISKIFKMALMSGPFNN